MRVYLAGGMRSPWRNDVVSYFYNLPDVEFLDPSTHGLTDEAEYTHWDLDAVKQSDVVFAYLEADNPSGYGMSLELGYAYALGKTIIFVQDPGHPQSRYFGMARTVATYLSYGFEYGIQLLLSLYHEEYAYQVLDLQEAG